MNPATIVNNFGSIANLLAELDRLVKDGYIYESKKGTLSLFNYSDKCTFEKTWNPATRLARGLIIDRETNTIICWPMSKFFNYLENPNDTIPNEGFQVQEKVDGSCIFLWMYQGEWFCSTRGSFNSDQAIWAQKYIDSILHQLNLYADTTYIFEAVYPGNKIVVNYDGYAGLYALTAYQNGIEVSKQFLCEAFDSVNHETADDTIRYPLIYSYDNIESLVELCKTIPKDEEGFVVRWNNGFRLKFKGAEYLRVHKLISHVTPLGIWELLVNNDNIDAVKQQLPEEFWTDFDGIAEKLKSKFQHIKSHNILWVLAEEKMNNLDRKTFAKQAIESAKKDSLLNTALLFKIYDDKELDDMIWKMIRPTGNKI
jgi:RNA ligase